MTSPRPRLGTAFATTALVVAGLTMTQGPATAVSATLSYDCTTPFFLGSTTFTAVIDTDAPATLGTGLSTPITTTATVSVSSSMAGEMDDAGIKSVTGTADATGTVDGVDRQTTLTIPSTPLVRTGFQVVGTGSSGSITAGAVGSSILLGAGNFVATFQGYDSGGSPMGPAWVFTCTLLPAQELLVDTVSVVKAPTSTVITVQGTPIQYGDTPDVTAQVSVPGSNAKPVGTIAFTYAGKTVTVDVKGGKAKPTSLAQALTKGTNAVTAVFTPTDPDLAPSESVKEFKVVKAASVTSTSAVYRPAKHKIVARSTVSSAFGTPVAGEVKYVLKRDGVKLRSAIVALNANDVAKKVFKNVSRRGTYAVVARYLGSKTLKQSSDKVTVLV